jgi:hypothetical protein
MTVGCGGKQGVRLAKNSIFFALFWELRSNFLSVKGLGEGILLAKGGIFLTKNALASIVGVVCECEHKY